MARRKLRGSGFGQNRPYVGTWSGVPGSTPTKPKPKPAPAAPPAPAPLTPQPLPVDPIYTNDVGWLNTNYDQTIAGVGFDRTQLGQTYGFDQYGNLDPSNPYSVAANLQRRYQQGQSGTTNSMASQGQLYSGALQGNLDEGTFQYSRSYDDARRQAMTGYQRLTEREQQAGFDKNRGIGEADSDRLLRLDPQDVVPPSPAPQAARVHPTKTKSHTAAGLDRIGPNLYVGPNGTKWKRIADGTFKRA